MGIYFNVVERERIILEKVKEEQKKKKSGFWKRYYIYDPGDFGQELKMVWPKAIVMFTIYLPRAQ